MTRRFEVLPHPEAPTFSKDGNPELIIEQLIKEVTSDNFQTVEKVMGLIREAGFVNLWFFLKFVAGYSGPYDRLNENLHLDMANFRQSPACMEDGARGAGFISRFMYKSTIWTHGASTWEAVRDPDIRIRIVNAVVGRAQTFVNIIKNTFKYNEFFKVLYPEYVMPPLQADCTLPNRTKHFPEPTVKAGGATGASEGDHHDLVVMDDLVGLDDLDIERAGNINMEQKNHWWETNTEMLVQDWLRSRLLCYTTLYSIDDPYHNYVLSDLKKLLGYEDAEYKSLERKDGSWTVYYRCALEDGEAICPEAMPKDKIMKLIESKPWSAMTQIFNKPKKAGMSEFSDYRVKRAKLLYDAGVDDFVVRLKDGNFEERTEYRVSEMDVCAGWDPAFTDKGISAKTSKTGIAVWGMTWDEQVVLLGGKSGYFSYERAFEELMDMIGKFDGYVRLLGIETNAGQKILPGLTRKELQRRGLFVSIKEVPSSQDKIVRIRSGIGRWLMRDAMIVCDGPYSFFFEEQQVFPQSKFGIDFLDASEKALSILSKPLSPDEAEQREYMEDEVLFNPTVNATTGY